VTQDLKLAIRSLARNPVFATVAMVTIAVGIGLNTSVFGIVNVLLFRPPSVDAAHELVWVSSASTKSNGPRGNMTYPDVEDLRTLPVIADIMAYGEVPANVSTPEIATRLTGQLVSSDFFSVLRLQPHRGRLLTRQDDAAGGSHVAVISFSLWQRLFAGRDAAIGTTLNINGTPFTVVGVTPRGFRGPSLFALADVWAPIVSSSAINPDLRNPQSRTSWWLRSIARLTPGVSTVQAAAAFRATAAAIGQAYPDSHDGFTIRIDPVRGAPPGDQENAYPVAAILLSATMTVLLIACANVANLLIVRGLATGRDTAIRLALGASRGRLVRQTLVESGVLALGGGTLGLLLSMWSTEPLLRFAAVPLEADFTPDRKVLLFSIVLSAVTGLLFSVAPAVRRASAAPAASLKTEPGSGDARPRSRLQSLLVAGQLALSLVLLLAAGMFLKGLANARSFDVGFDPQNRVSVMFNLRMHGYSDERATTLQRSLVDRVRAMPGVRAATLATLVPLGGRVSVGQLAFPDRAFDPDGRGERVSTNDVWPEFFRTLGIPILAGRPLDDRDMAPGTSTAVISQAMADHYWPGQNAIGERFSLRGPRGPFIEVVGVARDTYTDKLTEQPWAAAYLPRQPSGEDISLIVHTALPPGEALRSLAAHLRALDSSVAVFDPMTLREHIANRLDGERSLSRLLTLIGMLALSLAGIGLYGVVAYTVLRRTREIGVRIALGAQPHEVVRLFVWDAGRLALAGLGAGILPAAAVTALLAGSLVGVGMADPTTIGGVIAVLTIVTVAAAYLPARRASRIDPLIALRSE
jgi:predicted permease